MTGLTASNPLHYLLQRPYDPRLDRNKHTKLLRDRLDSASKLFKKNLVGHYGCVNAIEFSDKGDFLVSGGDDQRVLLWPTERAVDGLPCNPAVMQAQHKSNIFCLAIDSQVSRVFSGGNDDQVLVHDAATGSSVDNFLHELPVYGLSLDPLCDSIFASACDDGRVLIYDIREPPTADPLCLASSYAPYHAVMFNPVEPRTVVTANSQDGVGVWDVRRPQQRVSEFGASGAFQNCMSVRFNRSGTQILALRRRLPPVIFQLNNPTPLVQFYHPEYYNSCTMKSCSFGGDNDQLVMSGSDDFNLYVWKIPESDELNQWECQTHMVLRGHRSIVNQVRFEPTKGVIASSGVEKIIKLWSTFELPRNNQTSPDDGETARKVYSHEEYVSLVQRSDQLMTHNYSGQSLTEDVRMMAFFDSLVQREIQSWTSDEEASLHSPDNTAPLATLPGENGVLPTGGANRISRLIAQKRSQLVRLAKREQCALAKEDHQPTTDTDSSDDEMTAVRARFKRRRSNGSKIPAVTNVDESSSSADLSTPSRLTNGAAPPSKRFSEPDGISPEPCSSGINAETSSPRLASKRAATLVKKVLFVEKVAEPAEESDDLTTFKKTKRQRRSYRKQAEESDSN